MEGAAQTSFLVCETQDLRVALPLQSVIETMRPLPVNAVGGLPPFVIGVAVIRGEPTPVVDANWLLTGSLLPRPSRFVTLRADNRRVAVAISAVLDVRSIPADVLEQLPPLLKDAGEQSVQAMGVLDDALLVVLRASKIVPDSVWSNLSKFEAQP